MTATEILKKHGIKPTKTQKANAKIKKVMKDKARVDVPVALDKTGAIAGPRAELMAQAKARGIKYFGILKHSELQQVLSPIADVVIIKDITDRAKARWKSGWGKKSEGACV